MPITRFPFQRIDGVPPIPAPSTHQSDLSIAVAAVQAAARAAQAARSAPLKTRAKGVAADVVTDADAAAEHAAVSVIRDARPGDAIVGEEGTDDAGAGARRWYVDGIDGTVGFAAGMPGAWCSAVVLTDEHGPLACAAHNPAGEQFAAARGQGATLNGERLRLAPAKSLDQAHVAIFLRQDRLVLPGVRETAHRVLDRTALIRHAGPGTLELAWVAAGRLDAWIQPATDPWDWLPGALLVTEAGGEARTLHHHDTRWHIAGPSALVDALSELVS
jgi:myo-inositol-1(or 4)-monophosphatase